MDMSIVQGFYKKLETCQDTFQDLHERYCIYRAEETETEEERRATVAEETYSQQVLDQIFEVRKEFVRYKKALEAQDRAVEDSIKVETAKNKQAAQIILKADAIVNAKIELDCKGKQPSL